MPKLKLYEVRKRWDYYSTGVVLARNQKEALSGDDFDTGGGLHGVVSNKVVRTTNLTALKPHLEQVWGSDDDSNFEEKEFLFGEVLLNLLPTREDDPELRDELMQELGLEEDEDRGYGRVRPKNSGVSHA